MRFAKTVCCSLLLALVCASSALAAPRFTDNADQTVTDTQTGLMWTKNADLPGLEFSWGEGFDFVAAMNSANDGTGTFGHKDWRVPAVDELESLVDLTRSSPALSAGNPFIDVVNNEYWSSSYTPNTHSYVYGVNIGSGSVVSLHYYNFGSLWPVRGVRNGPVPLASAATGVPYGQLLMDTGQASLNTATLAVPSTWSLISGALPPGLTLNGATGAITGTPTTAGVFNFTVQNAGAGGTGNTRTLTITITGAVCGSLPVRLAGATPVSYPDFPGAYAQAADNGIIQMQALDFSGDLLCNRDVRFSLQGGYDCGFSGSAAAAGVLGALRMTGGTAKIAGLRFK